MVMLLILLEEVTQIISPAFGLIMLPYLTLCWVYH